MKLVSLTAIAALAAGCDGGGSGDVPLAELGARMGATICPKMVACCTAEELMEELLGAENQMECEAFYAGFLGTLLVPILEDSVANGRLRYDGAAMADCLDAMAALECADLRDTTRSGISDACGDPFIGLVADGGMCANDADCVSGYCNGDRIDFEGNITEYGACAVLPGVGQGCLDGDCAAGLRCDVGGGSICSTLLADGSTCGRDDDCASGECLGLSPSSDGTCGPSMTCDGV